MRTESARPQATASSKRRAALAALCGLVLAPLAAVADPVPAHPLAAAGVSVRFEPEDPAGSPFPSDRFTVRDWGNLTFRRVDLPRPDCGVRPSDCADLDILNTLDGFSTQPRITVPFTGAIDPASVNSETVFLVNLGNTQTLHGAGERIGINQVVWDPATLTVAFESDQLLNQHSRYLLAVTDGVRDAGGQPLRPGGFDRLVEQPVGAGATPEFLRDLRDAARIRGGLRNRLVAATLFTTQSVSADLEKIARRIKLSTPTPADFMIGNAGGPAPARAVFSAAAITSILFTRQIGTAPSFAAPAPATLSSLAVLPGAVATLAYGTFDSPDYETAEKFIPASGTLSGEPAVQGSNRLLFMLFVPSGPKPAGGWPVAIFEHGGGATIHAGSEWRVAAMLASQGIATMAIHAVGHGGGPLGTLTVKQVGVPDVVLNAGGRGIDQDGNGTIDASEGSRAAAPRFAIGNRDGSRQTAIDTLQLVRQIEVGIDFDGDAVADLDPSRLAIVGQSAGASPATLVLATDSNVRLGVLNVVGGSPIETNRLGGARVPLGNMFAARVPSLINVGGPSGLEFNENIPLRNLPPVVNSVPGAMALAKLFDQYQWVQQSGDPVAFAPFIRKSPLAGQSEKAVLLQFAKGDRTHPNPTNTAVLRAGDLADRATLFRNDLAFALNPAVPKDGHFFMTSTAVPALLNIALAAQRQIAVFIATNGATTLDPDEAGALFEVPIVPPLPETLGFIP